MRQPMGKLCLKEQDAGSKSSNNATHHVYLAILTTRHFASLCKTEAATYGTET